MDKLHLKSYELARESIPIHRVIFISVLGEMISLMARESISILMDRFTMGKSSSEKWKVRAFIIIIMAPLTTRELGIKEKNMVKASIAAKQSFMMETGKMASAQEEANTITSRFLRSTKGISHEGIDMEGENLFILMAVSIKDSS